MFLIVFIWQFPHFDTIARMYRDDYARRCIRMLAVIDPDGEATARRVVVCSLLLIPISLTPLFLDDGCRRALEGIRAVKRGHDPKKPDALLLRGVVTILIDRGLRPEECFG